MGHSTGACSPPAGEALSPHFAAHQGCRNTGRATSWWRCTKAEGDILQAQSATARWHRAEEGPYPVPSPTAPLAWTHRKPLLSQNESKNLCLLPTSSERTSNAPALGIPFPCWTNPSPQVVQTFLAAPFLGAEGCTGITVTPLSEAAQSPQPETSSCLELSFKNQNQQHNSASALPSLGSSAAPHSRPLSLCAPSPPPSNASADSPAPSQEHKCCQQGGSCGQTASTVPSHSL